MTMTYEFDIAPHLYRARALRARRLNRWQRLHKHDGRAFAWRIAVSGVVIFWASVGFGIYALV